MAREASVAPPLTPTPAELEVDEGALHVRYVDGRWRVMALGGAIVSVRDAALAQRFVRHAAVRTGRERVDLVTPPGEGAIAPRAARLPGVPVDAAIVRGEDWDTAIGWLEAGGRLAGYTVEDLARLACLATSQYAIAVGECAAHVAAEMSWARLGPMRGAGYVYEILRPLEQAARRSHRAGEALVAALACGVTFRS